MAQLLSVSKDDLVRRARDVLPGPGFAGSEWDVNHNPAHQIVGQLPIIKDRMIGTTAPAQSRVIAETLLITID
jgi:hypothetical protein